MSKDRPKLDAQWLLGDEPKVSSRGAWVWPASVGFLFAMAVVVWTWPTASKWWLQRQFQSQLQNAKSTDEVLTTLMGLGELLPESLSNVIASLQRNESESTRLAYYILNLYLDRLLIRPIDERRILVQSFIESLEQAHGTLDNEGVVLASALAAHVLEGNRQDTHPIASSIADSCKAIIASANQRAQTSASDKDSKTTDAILTASRSVTATIRSETAGHSDVAGESASLSTRNELPELVGSVDTTAPRRQSSANVPVDQLELASRPLPVSVAKISPNLHVVNGTASIGVARLAAPQSISSTENALHDVEETNIAGMESLGEGDVVRLLFSVHSRTSQAAIIELERRNWSEQQLSFAIELYQGDSNQRMALMDQLILDQKLNPIPWLVWMAEEGDRHVRRKAVMLLGSMTDANAFAQLRSLQQREHDKEISGQIERVLAVSGTTLNQPWK